jgi:hypothetical protein
VDKFSKNLVGQLRKSRNFPTNTCPYSRHAQMIGENLVRGKPYPMLQEEPEHCGGSILATVLALYEARTDLAGLPSRIADWLASEYPDNANTNAFCAAIRTFSPTDGTSGS